MKLNAKLNFEVNSGAAFIMSFVALIGFAFYIKAPFTEFFFGIGSLYGWHTGRRLWRQLKCGTMEGASGDEVAGGAK